MEGFDLCSMATTGMWCKAFLHPNPLFIGYIYIYDKVSIFCSTICFTISMMLFSAGSSRSSEGLNDWNSRRGAM